MQRQLILVVNVNFHRILAKFAADGPNLFTQGRGEHHYLLVFGAFEVDVSNNATNISLVEELIALIQYEVLQLIKLEITLHNKLFDAPRSTHNNVGAVVLEFIFMLLTLV